MSEVRRPAPRRPAPPLGRLGRPLLIVTWGLAVMVTACSGDGGSGDGGASDGTTSPSRDGPTATAATGLRATAACEGDYPNNHVADLRWRPAEPPGDAQQLVLSYLEGGLDTDAFVQTPVLPPDQDEYHWIHLSPGGVRHWRVLTRHGDEWVASETATFADIPCPR